MQAAIVSGLLPCAPAARLLVRGLQAFTAERNEALDASPEPSTRGALGLAGPEALPRSWGSLHVEEELRPYLPCNRSAHGWEAIRQLAGTHLHFRAPTIPRKLHRPRVS